MTAPRTLDTPAPWTLCEGGDGREIEALAVPYSTPTRFAGMAEQVDPGAVDVSTLPGLPLLWRHDEPVGVLTAARDTEAGPVVRARVSETARGDEALTLVRDGAVRGVSIGFDPLEARDAGGVYAHTLIDVRELSLTPTPAYRDAAVLAVREQERPPMTETPTAPAPPAEAPAEVREALALSRETAARVAALEARDAHPLAAFRSFAEYAQAVYAGSEARAWADQITGDNPGVVPPAWIREIAGIVAQSRPLIEGTGGAAALPAGGMSLEWPYFDGDLSAIVAKQTAEKTEVHSVKVSFKRGTAGIDTYAAGSDVSLQLIERSDPSYLDGLLRVYLAAYSIATEAAFATEVMTTAGTATGVTLGATATAAEFRAFLVNADAAILDATGSGASVLALAPDVYAHVAGLSIAPDTGFFVDTPSVRIVRAKALDPGEYVATNGVAVRWHEDGPRSISALDVPKLGTDVALYGYGAAAVTLPKGIVKGTTA